jgi:hypothetical protein
MLLLERVSLEGGNKNAQKILFANHLEDKEISKAALIVSEGEKLLGWRVDGTGQGSALMTFAFGCVKPSASGIAVSVSVSVSESGSVSASVCLRLSSLSDHYEETFACTDWTVHFELNIFAIRPSF